MKQCRFYSKIFQWYQPKKIADLACGVNPLAYNKIPNNITREIKYFASDLNPKDMQFLNDSFEKFNIPGIAKNYDLTTLKIVEDEELKSCDLVFLFKALDSLEQIKKDISKELIKAIPSKKIIVSFPTRSLLSKKQFKIERRNWFFSFLGKEEYKYETFEVENEIFLMIDKS